MQSLKLSNLEHFSPEPFAIPKLAVGLIGRRRGKRVNRKSEVLIHMDGNATYQDLSDNPSPASWGFP
jgi:hypothetical protein